MQRPAPALAPVLALTLILALAACGGGGGGDATSPTPTPSPPPAQVSAAGLYVANADGSVAVFAPDASGDAAPVRRIAGSRTGLSLSIGLATDSQQRLYVTNRGNGTVAVFPVTASGDVAPSTVLSASGMGSPQVLAVGPTDDVYVATCPGCGSGNGGGTGVWHFANGSTVSDFQIGGANTGMTVPTGIALDSGRNLYVANAFGGNVATFAPGASGNSLPIRSFTVPSGANIQSMSVGAGSGANAIAIAVPGRGVELYPLSASGSATPAATLAPSAQLPLQYPGGVLLDNTVTPPVVYLSDFDANRVYVIQTAGTAPNLTVASVRTIGGPNTRLQSPLGVWVVK